MKTFFQAFQLKDERHLIRVKGGTIPFPLRKDDDDDEDEDGSAAAAAGDSSCPNTKSSLSSGFQK